MPLGLGSLPGSSSSTPSAPSASSASPSRPVVAGAVLDDRAVRQREGFDFYGRLAMGFALLPLIRVTPHQVPPTTHLLLSA